MFYDYYMFQLPYDYIRGLVDGEGTFTFSTSPKKLKDGFLIAIKSIAELSEKRDKKG